MDKHKYFGRKDLTPEEKAEYNSWQRMIRSEKVNMFISEFISPLLPNASLSSTYTFGNPQTSHTHAEIEIISSNRDLEGSDYYLPLTKSSKLVHFTSLTAALNIIRSSSLRLYSLDHMDDPQEFIYAASKLGFEKNWNLDKIKSQLFSVSFVLNDNSQEEELEHWRYYGNDGFGVALVFSVDESVQTLWHDYHLSKIWYDDRKLESFGNLPERLRAFREKHTFHIDGPEKTFSKLFAFHKASMFHTENEVRLLHYFDHGISHPHEIPDKIRPDLCYDINRSGKESLFVELPIGLKYQERVRKFSESDELFKNYWKSIPSLRLSQIIVGYRNNYKNFCDNAQTIFKQARLSLGHTDFEIVPSKYAQHFSTL